MYNVFIHRVVFGSVSGEEHFLLEWEYLPAIGPRPPKGFVGLKNAGATCYMNSVIQQLFMIDAIRTYILQVGVRTAGVFCCKSRDA